MYIVNQRRFHYRWQCNKYTWLVLMTTCYYGHFFVLCLCSLQHVCFRTSCCLCCFKWGWNQRGMVTLSLIPVNLFALFMMGNSFSEYAKFVIFPKSNSVTFHEKEFCSSTPSLQPDSVILWTVWSRITEGCYSVLYKFRGFILQLLIQAFIDCLVTQLWKCLSVVLSSMAMVLPISVQFMKLLLLCTVIYIAGIVKNSLCHCYRN